MKTQRIVEILKSDAVDTDVVVKGWVRTKRGNKNVAFIALNDGSCVGNIQVVVDLAKISEEQLKPVTTGACLRVDGRLVASPGAGQGVEVQAEKSRFTVRPTPRAIPCRRRGIRWSFCAKSPTCVRAPTRSVRCSASVTPWLTPSTNISTNTDSTISTPRSSRLRTAKAPARCSR